MNVPSQEQTLVSVIRTTAVGLFGVASIAQPVPAVAAAILGAVLVALSLVPDHIAEWRPHGVVRRAPVVVSVVAVVMVGIARGSFSRPGLEAWTLAIWLGTIAVCIGLYALDRRWARQSVLVLSVVLMIGLSLGVMIRYGGNVFGLDPYLSHEAAADALLEGLNPYTGAVMVPNGSPNAELGEVIEGYSYPPVTLVAYSTADWLLGDPRWASVWAIVGAMIAIVVRSKRAWPGVTAGVIAVLAASPTVRSVVWAGWTEPVTLVFLVGAILTWRRSVASGLLLGLALATKQYMVVLVPLLVLIDWRDRSWKRSAIAISTAAMTIVPFALWDIRVLWSVLVERPLGLEPRVDSQSLSGAFGAMGLDMQIPIAVMLGAVLLASWWLVQHWTPNGSWFASSSALVLAVVFLFSMAFTNYWWLVQWLAAAAAILGMAEPVTRGAEPLRSTFESAPGHQA